MLHVNDKYFNSHHQSWKDNFWKKKKEKWDSTSVNLEKPLEYLKIQETLQSENLREHFLCQGLFLCFSLPWKMLDKHKVEQVIKLAKLLWLFA